VNVALIAQSLNSPQRLSGTIFSLKVIFSCQAILDNFAFLKIENTFLFC